MKALDQIHHIAVEVGNIADAVQWYRERFRCELSYQDETWAMLRFGNLSLAFVLPGQHPAHIAFEHPDAERFGELIPHRDGTRSVYIEDDQGNVVEIMAVIDPRRIEND